MRRISIISCLSLLLLAACGGGSADLAGSGGTIGTSSGGTSSGGTSSGGTSSGGTSVAATSLTATTSASSIPLDGSSSATITVLARNAQNDLISGVDVSFTASAGGGIAVTTGTTGTDGAATATLTAVDATLSDSPIIVTATAGSLTTTVQIQVASTSGSTTTAVASLTLSTSTPYIFSDGSTTATITAQALDAGNNALAGVPVTFTTAATGTGIAGALQVTQPSVTGPSGTLTAVLSTGGNSASRNITVSGTTAGLSTASTVGVAVVPPLTPVMGYGSGANFVAGVIGVGAVPPNQISAGGTTSISVTVTDQGGTLYNASPVTVSFNSTCIANGQAEILAAGSSTPTQSITTSSGSIGATYVAKGCSGTDTITASATAAGLNLSATGAVSIAAAAIGSIQFVSATPTIVGLKGTGLNDTSTVIFKVSDSTGGAEANVPVSFALNTSVGGLSLSPASAVTASDGTVQTVVSSGTVHTAVTVTASVSIPANPPNPAVNISATSSGLSVTTGLPASGSFSISVGKASNAPGNTQGCPNVEGFDINLLTVPVTVQLADRYGNPAPDGTSIAFQTDGGTIAYPGGQKSGQAPGGGSCTTPFGTPGDGACQMIWTSANPRPGQNPYTGQIDLSYGYPVTNPPYHPLLAAGRAVILATTIGEESFTDLNASGFYQAGDPFADLGDPYEDDNEQGAYELGDPFVDFYHTGTWAPPSGSFIGITCTGITASSTCTPGTLEIGTSHLMIMSTSIAATPVVTTTGFGGTVPNLTLPNDSAGTIVLQIADQNGNPMAAGTTVTWGAFSNTSAGLTITPTSSPEVVGCDSDLVQPANRNELYEATFTPNPADSGSGSMTVTITSPSGSQSLFGLNIDVLPPVPVVTFSASPNPVAASGDTSTLTWSSSFATSCTATGAWTGTEPTSGTFTTAGITVDTTFNLTCTGAGGTSPVQSVTIAP
jgi:hypothetical protein